MLTFNDFYAIPKDFILNGEIENYRLYSYFKKWWIRKGTVHAELQCNKLLGHYYMPVEKVLRI
jgi:hypothetical protein